MKPHSVRLPCCVNLADGSVIKGVLHRRFVPAISDTLGGAFRLDLRTVASITFAAPGGSARIFFQNQDCLSARLAPKHDRFVLDTLIGTLTVPLASVESLAIMDEASLTPDSSFLLYYCTFDSPSSITHPAVGPAGQYLGGDFITGKVGNALRVRTGLSSAVIPFGKGVLQPSGTIEFWAKIENDRESFGDGGDPRFFMMETSSGSETVFQIAANDGCGRGGLSIYHQGISVASENHCLWPARYDSVLPGAIKGWHHYALVWNADGVPETEDAVAAFIDGRRMPLYGDTGLAKAAHMAARIRDNPATLFFSLNPALNRGFNNKTDFLIDEFRIWSIAKTTFDLR